jgi:hypothetical protein
MKMQYLQGADPRKVKKKLKSIETTINDLPLNIVPH